MARDDPSDDGWTPGELGVPPSSGGDRWGPLRDFVRERLPPAVRGARLDPGLRGAVAIALVALVAAAAAVIVAWRSAARPVAGTSVRTPAVAVPALTPGPLASGTSPASTASPEAVVVDVAGKVRRPGVVTVPAGARVADAIASAGGLLPGTSTTGLSLARRLIDGEQVIVGLPQPSAAAPAASDGSSGGEPGQPVNLNTATASDLDALPGIGPVLAQRVLDWRTEHGGFTSVDQLREVSGLGGKKFDALAPLVRV
jgi:competence protein ComEA